MTGTVLVVCLLLAFLGELTSGAGPTSPAQPELERKSHSQQERLRAADAPVSSHQGQSRGHVRPPRGYCVRVSRAIKPSSPCHKHLVEVASGQLHSKPQDSPRAALPAHEAPQQEQNRPKRFASILSKHGSEPQPNSRLRREELVYVRSETLGEEITNLSTQAINERLVRGLLLQLLGPGGSAPEHLAGGQASDLDLRAWTDLGEIRKQIAGTSSAVANELTRAEKCKMGVERFICRLVYPACHFRSIDVGALVRPPCREDCLLLRDQICPNLDWPKFTGTLRRAFNATLRKSINALGLLVDGDTSVPPPQAPPPPPPRAPLVAQQNYPPALKLRSGQTPEDQSGLGRSSRQARQSVSNRYQASRRTTSQPTMPTLTWPAGLDLSASLHFYWPHEHSIDRCELLPPLRLLAPHVDVGLARASRDATAAAATKWVWDHRRNGAICSNAHLTETLTGFDLEPNDEFFIPRRSSVSGDDGRGTGHGSLAGPEVASQDPRPHQSLLSHPAGLECLATSNGAHYEGSKNTTRSGLACQHWTDQKPHKHKSSELLFDNMRDSHNYCRNPGGLDANGPFCYTMNKDVRWEYCQIERCKIKSQ